MALHPTSRPSAQPDRSPADRASPRDARRGGLLCLALGAAAAALAVGPASAQAGGPVPLDAAQAALLASAQAAFGPPSQGAPWVTAITGYEVIAFKAQPPTEVRSLRTPDPGDAVYNCRQDGVSLAVPKRDWTVTSSHSVTTTVSATQSTTMDVKMSADFGVTSTLASSVTNAVTQGTSVTKGDSQSVSFETPASQIAPNTGFVFLPSQFLNVYKDVAFTIDAIPTMGRVTTYAGPSTPVSGVSRDITAYFIRNPTPVRLTGTFEGKQDGDVNVVMRAAPADEVAAVCAVANGTYGAQSPGPNSSGLVHRPANAAKIAPGQPIS